MKLKKLLLSLFSALLLVGISLPVTAFAANSTSGDVTVLGTAVSKDQSTNYTTYYKVQSNALVAGTEDDYNVSYSFDSSGSGKGTLTLKDFSAQKNQTGFITIKSKYPVEIVLVGTNEFKQPDGYSVNYGLDVQGADNWSNPATVTFSGEGSLTITVATKPLRSDYNDKKGEFIFSGGNITLNAVSSDSAYGISAGNVTQNGGTLTLNVGKQSTGWTVGIEAKTGTIALNSGTLALNMKPKCASNDNVFGLYANTAISFGSGVEAKIVIDDTTYSSYKLMNKTPTIANAVYYGPNADGSGTTKLETTGTISVLSTTKPLRYFETPAVAKYTVKYTDGVDGEEVFADKSFVKKDGDTMPAFGDKDPERSGYSFEGWKDAEGKGVAATVTKDVTYTAQWKKIYTIKYTDGVAGETIFADQEKSVKEGDSIPAYEGNTPTRTKYKFTGWSPEYKSTDTASKDVTYEAQWEELYTVTYKDGFTLAADKAFSDDVHADIEKDTATPAFVGNGYGTTPIKEGYKFTGWNPSVDTTVTADATYTAQWTKLDTTNEVQVFNQQVSLDQEGAYTTYWKAIDVTVGEHTFTKLFPSDENDYNVKYECDPEKDKRELTLKDLQTDNASPASTPQSYIFIKSENDIKLILEGTNKLGYDPKVQTINNAISFYGIEKPGQQKVSIGDLTISGSGSLETTSNRTGISSANGEGKVTIESTGDIKLHVHADGQGAEGIRCRDYEQTAGNVVLDLQDPNSGAMADSTGFVGQVTQPYEPGTFEQTGGRLQIKVATKAKAFGVIGFNTVHIGADIEDTEIILDNGDNWTRLFGLGDDNEQQTCTLIIDNDSIYGRKPDGTNTIDLPEGDDTDILQHLGAAQDTNKLHYFHQGTKKYTVTYTDGVEDKVVFEDEVHKNLAKNSTTPVFNGGVNPTREGYDFVGWEDEDGNKGVAEKVTKDITYIAQWKAYNYKVVFNKNNLNATGEMTDESFEFDEQKALTKNGFKLTGYHFTGWTENPDGTGKKFADSQEVLNLTNVKNGTVNVYAQWAKNNYKVVFNKNATDAKGTMEDEQFAFNEKKALNKLNFSREGYKFVGWNTQPDGKGTSYKDQEEVMNLALTDGAVVYLYAQWEVINYKVVFDKNATDAKGTMEDELFKFDEKKALYKLNFTRDGYTFIGWNTQADGKGTTYKDEQEVVNLTLTDGAVVYLYAQWSSKPVTGDKANPLLYVGIGVISILALAGAGLLLKKKILR